MGGPEPKAGVGAEEHVSTGIVEIMPELFTRSTPMILDFSQIPDGLPFYQNLKAFFEQAQIAGIDPKLPQNRQAFNNVFLERTGMRYLTSGYLEDMIEILRGSQIEREGRTLHLGVDVFSRDLEDVFAPSDAEIVASSREEERHSFGNYVILKPDPSVTPAYIFLGHLSSDLPSLGKVKAGQRIARLGDYVDEENGGWSRHVHVQLMRDLPDPNRLIGYTARETLDQNRINYPDPSFLVFK